MAAQQEVQALGAGSPRCEFMHLDDLAGCLRFFIAA